MVTLQDIEKMAIGFEALTKEVDYLKKVVDTLKIEQEPLLIQKEAARRLGVTEATIINYRKRGIIKPIFTGKKFRYPNSEIERIKAGRLK